MTNGPGVADPTALTSHCHREGGKVPNSDPPVDGVDDGTLSFHVPCLTDRGDVRCDRPSHGFTWVRCQTRAGTIRTLESLARIELGAQGGALVERVTTTRTSKSGVVTTTVRERWTPPDWRADGWFLERRHPAEWSRRTEFVLPDDEQVKEVDPLVGL